MDAGYAGDAHIDLPPGQDRLLSYGVDLETLATTKLLSNNVAVTVAIVKGSPGRPPSNVEAVRAREQSAKDKTIIIEHPGRGGWTLVDTLSRSRRQRLPFQGEGAAHRWRRSPSTVGQTGMVAMLPMDVNSLLFYQRNGSIPSAVRDAIGKAIALKNAMADLDRQMRRGRRASMVTAEQAESGEHGPSRTPRRTTSGCSRSSTSRSPRWSRCTPMRRAHDQT
jgi:hypothetical protein